VSISGSGSPNTTTICTITSGGNGTWTLSMLAGTFFFRSYIFFFFCLTHFC
jgi:hypothetical protein